LGTASAADAPAGANDAGKAPKAAKKKDKGVSPTAFHSTFGDDIDRIDATCELTETQKKRFELAKTQREKELQKYDVDMAPKLAKIEDRLMKLDAKSKDAQVVEARKQLEAFKEQIVAGRERLVQTHVGRMFALLTADQKAKWNAPVLTEEMIKEFSVLMLEPRQTDRITTYCAQQARVLTMPVDPARPEDKLLTPVKLQIYKTILTPAQQAEYRKLKTPEPAAKGGKKATKPGNP